VEWWSIRRIRGVEAVQRLKFKFRFRFRFRCAASLVFSWRRGSRRSWRRREAETAGKLGRLWALRPAPCTLHSALCTLHSLEQESLVRPPLIPSQKGNTKPVLQHQHQLHASSLYLVPTTYHLLPSQASMILRLTVLSAGSRDSSSRHSPATANG